MYHLLLKPGTTWSDMLLQNFRVGNTYNVVTWEKNKLLEVIDINAYETIRCSGIKHLLLVNSEQFNMCYCEWLIAINTEENPLLHKRNVCQAIYFQFYILPLAYILLPKLCYLSGYIVIYMFP